LDAQWFCGPVLLWLVPSGGFMSGSLVLWSLSGAGHDLGGLVEPAGEFGCGGGQLVGVIVAGVAERGEHVGGAAGRAGVQVGGHLS
jgi:hypothetical protein